MLQSGKIDTRLKNFRLGLRLEVISATPKKILLQTVGNVVRHRIRAVLGSEMVGTRLNDNDGSSGVNFMNILRR